jgi:hypothetical protein
MAIRNLLVVTLSLAPLFVIPENASACACCARADEWTRKTGASEFERGEIQRLSLLPGMLIEGVGERDPLFFRGPVRVGGMSPKPGVWEVVIKPGENGAPSVLRFVPDGPWDFFQTYTGPWPDAPASEAKFHEVTLYKEVALPGAIRITGPIVESFGQDFLPAVLVFKGQGNRCFSGSDFSQWILRFTLPRADGDITFVGSGRIATE